MSVLDQLFQLYRIAVQHVDGVLRMSARGGDHVFTHASPMLGSPSGAFLPMKRGLLGTVVALLVSTPLGPAWAQFDPAFNHLECYSIKAAQPFERRTVTVETQFGIHTAVE